ncbi:DEAD/DEAH box helicase family protein [Sporosarcina sp. FSL K6-5500]|uniref:DEAD/DEAH box helicase family protein n=1 Tax=Sporosarcina sp. FSL K6-5500 TaxID=2921558 RepID=UPI0030F93FAF
MTEVRLITSNLIGEIKELTQKAENIYWIVAFAMKSGVKLVLPHLKKAAANGAEIKIVIGDYLHINQPEALELLFTELPNAEIRLYESRGVSFHPKAYLFRADEKSHIIVGSSNLSASAMMNGIEWNLYAPSTVDENLFETAMSEFMKQFLSTNTMRLNPETLINYKEAHRQSNLDVAVSEVWAHSDEIEVMFGVAREQETIFEMQTTYETKLDIVKPRPVQLLALEALQQTREEDYNKALVVLATGLGKTYLAAFFAHGYKKVLFIAHREEILEQAESSFKHVHPLRTTGIYNGFVKEADADFLFASVFTLATDYHLHKFRPDEFDLIIIDEFHHAVAPTYERILNYFSPEFLLGITATPDRLDNKDVYSLCDGNVAISIHFLEAIRQNWLSPFIYYGVFDKTDYSGLQWRNNSYDEEGLLRLQLRYDYADAVLSAWEQEKQSRTIGFCSSVKQAVHLSQHFNKAGYKTIALHGKTERNTRLHARKRLELGELDVIFTVDLFNEGVDIPSVDTLLFARPTESLTVFTQQIGRGLRLANGKSHCVIIDLIGNYRNAEVKMRVFTEYGEQPKSLKSVSLNLPENCDFQLDLAVVNLLEEMKRKRSPRKQQLVDAFSKLKTDLGVRPTYLEFHLKADADSRFVRQEFDSYPGLLAYAGELSDIELDAFEVYKNWIQEATGTGMTKSYKMIVLHYMLSRGQDEWLTPVTPEQIAPYFHRYFTEKDYRIRTDFSDNKGKELRIYNEKKITSLLTRMPLSYWSDSSKGLISFLDNVFIIHVTPLAEHAETLFRWTKEICDYRLHAYFERKSNLQ